MVNMEMDIEQDPAPSKKQRMGEYCCDWKESQEKQSTLTQQLVPISESAITTSATTATSAAAATVPSFPETEICIKIVSAEYGPCEGVRLQTGELSDYSSTSIPITRDVTPFLRAMLVARKLREEQKEDIHRIPRGGGGNNKNDNDDDNNDDEEGDDNGNLKILERRLNDHDDEEDTTSRTMLSNSVRIPSRMGETSIFILLLGGRESMNGAFGDPCPGISKRLFIHYIITEASIGDDAKTRAAKTEVHHVSFAEHEPVVLRRRLTFYQDDATLRKAVERSTKRRNESQKQQQQEQEQQDPVANDCNDNDDDELTLRQARNMGRSQSIAEFTEDTMSLDAMRISQSTPTSFGSGVTAYNQPDTAMIKTPTTSSTTRTTVMFTTDHPNALREGQYFIDSDGGSSSHSAKQDVSSFDSLHPFSVALPSQMNRRWRLRSAVSEIVLPIVLPYLDVRERVQCRLVCRSWKHVVRDWGVATHIDSNDPNIAKFTIPYLRGIMKHSYTSLRYLFIGGLERLTKADLHPSLSHLRNLRSLDVTGCNELDDTTLQLLAEHVHPTLEVLYIKGLRRVTDVGIQAICRSCAKLEVLDISHIPITDQGAIAIQQLKKLRALYTRDNYYLTNQSIDVITKSCTRLSQLTLWGCIRLKHLTFGAYLSSSTPSPTTIPTVPSILMTQPSSIGGKNLVYLNLWGCHALTDEAAQLLGSVTKLRSLVVSECHRLTDQFVVELSKHVPQLNHLHLRYCKRITDMGVNAITNSMPSLYSLDLSFCTRVTATSIFNLLEIRNATLAELRLKDCHKLDIFEDDPSVSNARGRSSRHTAGSKILNVIRSHNNDSCLCLLDVRECGRRSSRNEPYSDRDPFVQGMAEMHFQQRLPGFFCRRGRLNASVQRRLVNQIVDESH